MQDKKLYEYAIIRLVPYVDRGEFINVGVALFSKEKRYLKFKFELNNERIKALAPQIDIKEVEEHLHAFQKICEGGKEGGFIGAQDMPSRFRWLTAKRSTIIQSSEVHPGYTVDLDETLQCIFDQMVG